jgi:hypothetical protein
VTHLAAALAALVLATGCASMFEHTRKEFSLQSIPDGAEFELTKLGNSVPTKVGVTPAALALPRGDGYFQPAHYRVHVHKEGYEPETLVFRTTTTANYWYNLLWLPILPPWPLVAMLIVDPLDGAMWELDVPTAIVLRKQVGQLELPPNE